MTPPVWVVGDVHGQPGKLRSLVARAGLTDGLGNWTGRDAVLVCLGDYVDRGPDGAGVIRLLMRLQSEAAEAGGEVVALLGNHEPMMLAAQRFGSRWRDRRGRTFVERWMQNGGRTSDLLALTPQLTEWLTSRPAARVVGSYLLLHADSLDYLNWGSDLNELNRNVRAALDSDDPYLWDQLINSLSERWAFTGDDGAEKATRVLHAYGGERIVHGHTPLAYLLNVEPEHVGGPFLYAAGRALNVDGGLTYHDTVGFIAQIGPARVEKVIRATP